MAGNKSLDLGRIERDCEVGKKGSAIESAEANCRLLEDVPALVTRVKEQDEVIETLRKALKYCYETGYAWESQNLAGAALIKLKETKKRWDQ